MAIDDDALLTVKETAVIIRRSGITLKRWRKQGKGPSYLRVEGRILYRYRDLMEWVDSNLVLAHSASGAA